MQGHRLSTIFAAALVAAIALIGLKPDTADAAGISSLATSAPPAATPSRDVEKVHYRKRYYRKRHWGKRRWGKRRHYTRHYRGYRGYDNGYYYGRRHYSRPVIVDAPFTHVYVGRGVHVRAPFVNLWVPRRGYW